MIGSNFLSTNEKKFLVIAIPALIISYLLNLGMQPIYLEEPRRALVALEMMLNNSYWAPTEFGVPYYNKPPLYNWLLCAIFYITGDFSEFYVRILSVVSIILLGIVHFMFTRKYIGVRFAIISSLFLMVSADIYFYYSLLGEMDLFYSLLVYCNIVVIYYFHDRQKYYSMFILAYLLAALGVLTKSFPSIAFLGISVMVVLGLKRDLKRLFSWSHFFGVLIFKGIIGTYLYSYSLNNDWKLLVNGLWHDSSKRTSFEGFDYSLVGHMLYFPLETLKNLLPISFLMVFFFRKSVLKSLTKDPFILFSIIVFLGNYLIYLISPEAKQRYVYCLYPFLINILLFVYFETKNAWKDKYLNIIAWTILVVGLAGFASLPFVPQFQKLPKIIPLSVGTVLLTAVMIYIQYRAKLHALYVILAVFILARVAFDMTVPPLRAQDDHASVRKHDGIEIASITKDQKVCLFKDSEISNGLVYYIVRETSKPVNREYNTELPCYYILDEKYFDDLTFITFYESEFQGGKFSLVKYK